MAKKTVGELIREARTAAGLTQEQLAKQIDGLSAADISKAERGEKELTQALLKLIAKATGVTQKSLLEAAAARKPAASKKTAAAAKPAAAAKKPAATAKKPAAKKSTAAAVKLTAAEKKLLELYRAAGADARKAAEAVLRGEPAPAESGNLAQSLLSGVVNTLIGK